MVYLSFEILCVFRPVTNSFPDSSLPITPAPPDWRANAWPAPPYAIAVPRHPSRRSLLLACTLFARSGNLADPIYVHAKIAIIDDNWLTLGSANLNEHSLFNDTEMNIVSHDVDLARKTRLRLWAEHLELPIEQIPPDPIQAIDELWKPISKEQLERRQAGQPLTHRLVRLPHVSRRSSRAAGPVTGVVVDG